MVFPEQDSFVKVLDEKIANAIKSKKIGVAIWQVTDIKSVGSDGYVTEYKCNIKNLEFKHSLDDVPIGGIGLGHRKGILKYPAVGDFVLVAFIGNEPIIIGTIYDYFSQSPDSVPIIKLNELAIIQKEDGSIILMKENNDILIRAAGSSGDFDDGAKIRLNSDGSFKLFNKDNYGIECDKDGNLVLRGVTIDHTQTAGAW